MSWATEMRCSNPTMMRYCVVMAIYIDGMDAKQFWRKYNIRQHSAHTIVSAVRTWMVKETGMKNLPAPRFMRTDPERYKQIINAILKRRGMRLPTKKDEQEEILGKLKPVLHRKHTSHTNQLPKWSSLAEQLLNAVVEIDQDKTATGALLIVTTDNGTKIAPFNVDMKGVDVKKLKESLSNPEADKPKESMFLEL